MKRANVTSLLLLLLLLLPLLARYSISLLLPPNCPKARWHCLKKRFHHNKLEQKNRSVVSS